MEILLFPSTAEYGISWDRLDGCANALIALIALDNQRYVRCGEKDRDKGRERVCVCV